MLSMLPSIVVLGLVALVVLSLGRQSPVENVRERVAAARALALATAIQGVHFAEETATGFHVLFPALFGLPPIPLAVFGAFNMIWIGIWIASVPGLRTPRPAAYFAAWFLALAAILNGIVHPLLAVAAGGYFPGLATSPFICAAGVLLWMRLGRATRRKNAATD